MVTAISLLMFAPGVTQAATRPIVPSYVNQTVDGTHFVVHYTSSGGIAADRLSTADAGTLLANAEKAHLWEVTQSGFPAPADDGDGKTDIYVFNTPAPLGGAAAGPDSNADQTSGFVLLSPKNAVSSYAVAHEFFHVIQMGIYQHAGFFTESTAEWAGQAVVAANGATPPPNWYPNPQVPLDCLGSSCSGDRGGYHGSIFWEYLSERFGTDFVHEAYDRDAVLATAAADHQPYDLQALGDVLAAHGSSIADAFNGYALAAVAGRITRPGVLPNVPVADHTIVANMPMTYAPDTVPVDHLALKRIAVTGAAPGSGAPCRTATLHMRVDLPSGVPTQPFFVMYPPSGEAPATAVYPLTVAGSAASVDVPWQLCASSVGALTLPNASSASDGQVFTVHVTADSLARMAAPRIKGKASQDVAKLVVRVSSSQAATLRGQASVKVPGARHPVTSRFARARIGAGRTVTLHFTFAKKNLRVIKKALSADKRLKAKIKVTAVDATGSSATAKKTVRLKP